jgi:hypothetical protein
MADPTPRPRPSGEPPEIADADLLFREETPRPASPSRQPSEHSASASGDVFDLEGGDPGSDEESSAPPRAPIPSASPRPSPSTAAERRPRQNAGAEPEARVDEVWTRGAEWGPTLILLAVVGAVVLLLFYLALGASLTLAFLVLLVGGALWIALAYPIVITLERPVRMTPEQAIKDYYGALSHHFPHYRRMWLLLSTPGKTSGSYGSFEGFRAYWKGRLKALRGDRAGGFTPLSFEITDFKAEKSAGKSAIEAKYSIVIHIRGQHAQGPIATYRAATWLVKGPDNMWYLNDGTLVERGG